MASIGEAIGLQGKDQGAEKIGNLVYQMGEAEANRNLKRDIYAAKKNKEDEDAIAKKFDLPVGKYNRLVVGDMIKTQDKYLNELKDLKLQRPNDWQNGISDLAFRYNQDMSLLSTRSSDLDKYEVTSSSLNKAGTYTTKNAQIFNEAYEKATDFNDLVDRLKKSGWQQDAQIQLRPNGSVSYTPFANTKPKQTLEQDIVARIPQIDYTTSSRDAAFGYKKEQKVQIRPVTRQKGSYGVSLEDIVQKNPNLGVANTIEDVVDEFLTAPQNGPESIVQYADQYGLKARFDENGQLIPEDQQAMKEHIMGWAKNFASPKVTTGTLKPQTQILQGPTEEKAPVSADLTPGELAGRIEGVQGQKLGIINYSFDKDPQNIDVRPSDTFTENYEPAKVDTLQNASANAVVVLAVDKDGKPIKLSGAEADNINNIFGADVFVRLKTGDGYFYKRLNNYANISNQFLKKPNGQLEAEVNKLSKLAASYDKKIADIKNNKLLKNDKKTKYTFKEIIDTPTSFKI